MENGTLIAGPVLGDGRSVRMRVSAVLAALALVLTMFVLVQQRADAAPAGGAAVAASVASVGSVDAAQLNFNQIICAALISLRNSFANSPFFGFVQAILNNFIAAFGCSPS
jgi:hypothetical protein